MIKWLLVAFILIFSVGCMTRGHFKLPQDSKLEIYGRKVAPDDDGVITTRPFFWTAAGGVKYKLTEKSGKVKEGKLRVKFRVVSVFWPPFAAIYWPMGLNPNIVYDLINDKQI